MLLTMSPISGLPLFDSSASRNRLYSMLSPVRWCPRGLGGVLRDLRVPVNCNQQC